MLLWDSTRAAGWTYRASLFAGSYFNHDVYLTFTRQGWIHGTSTSDDGRRRQFFDWVFNVGHPLLRRHHRAHNL